MNELVSELTSKLGIQEDQAKGGAGLIFNVARARLGGDFTKVAGAVPGIQGLMAAAPQAEPAQPGGGTSGGVHMPPVGGAQRGGIPQEGSVQGGGAGGLADIMREVSSGKGAVAMEVGQLAGGFQKLGLDAGMAGRFMPIILDFVKRKGGAEASGLLAKAVHV